MIWNHSHENIMEHADLSYCKRMSASFAIQILCLNSLQSEINSTAFSLHGLVVCTLCLENFLGTIRESLHSPREWHSSRICWMRRGYCRRKYIVLLGNFAKIFFITTATRLKSIEFTPNTFNIQWQKLSVDFLKNAKFKNPRESNHSPVDKIRSAVDHENIGSTCNREMIERRIVCANFSSNIYLSREFQVKHVFACHLTGLTFALFNRLFFSSPSLRINFANFVIFCYLLSQSVKSYYRVTGGWVACVHD